MKLEKTILIITIGIIVLSFCMAIYEFFQWFLNELMIITSK